MKKEILITVAFGTTDVTEFNRSFLSLYKDAIRKAEMPSLFSVTSHKVKSKLGYLSFERAMQKALDGGYSHVKVFALFLADGKEYRKVLSVIDEYNNYFADISVNKPFLTDMNKEIARYIDRKFIQNGKIKILLGHGTGTDTDFVYTGLLDILRSLGRDDFYLILEKNTDGMGELRLNGKEEIEVIPLMFTKGHHISEMYEKIELHCEQNNISCSLSAGGLGSDAEFRKLLTERYI